jgi:hypothetical protein
VDWEWSHCLRAESAKRDNSGATPLSAFLPDAAREDALQILRDHFSEDVFLEWLESISRVEYLYTELAEIPATFEELFVGKQKAVLG